MPTFQDGPSTNSATRAWVERALFDSDLYLDALRDRGTALNTQVEMDAHTAAGTYGEATAYIDYGVFANSSTDNDSAIDMDEGSDMDLAPKLSQVYRNIFNRTATELGQVSNTGAEEDQLGNTPRLRVFYYLSNRRLSEKRLCYNSPFFHNQLRELRRQQVDCAICKEPLHALPDRVLDIPSKRYHWQVTCVSCGHLFHWICISTWRATPMSKSAGDRCPHCRQSWLPPFSSLFPTLEPYAVDFYLGCMLKGWPSQITSPAQSLMGLPDSYAVGLQFENFPFCVKVVKSILEALNAACGLVQSGNVIMLQDIARKRGYGGLESLLGRIRECSGRHQSGDVLEQCNVETGLFADLQFHWQPPIMDIVLGIINLDYEMAAAVQRDLDARKEEDGGSAYVERALQNFSVS